MLLCFISNVALFSDSEQTTNDTDIPKETIVSSQTSSVDLDIRNLICNTQRQVLIEENWIVSSQSSNNSLYNLTPIVKAHQKESTEDNSTPLPSNIDIDIRTPEVISHQMELNRVSLKENIITSLYLDVDTTICTPKGIIYQNKLKKNLIKEKIIISQKSLDNNTCTPKDKIQRKKLIKENGIVSSQSSNIELNICTPKVKSHQKHSIEDNSTIPLIPRVINFDMCTLKDISHEKEMSKENGIVSSQSSNIALDICTPKDKSHKKEVTKENSTISSLPSSIDFDICTPKLICHQKELINDSYQENDKISSQSSKKDLDITTIKEKSITSHSLDIDVDICTPTDKTHHKRLKKDIIKKKSTHSSKSLDVHTSVDKICKQKFKKDFNKENSIISSQSLDVDVDICTPRDKKYEEKLKKDLIDKNSIKSSQSLDFDVDICTPKDNTHHKRLKKDLITKKSIKSSQSFDVDVDICTPTDKTHHKRLKKDLITKKSIKSSQSLDADVDICTPRDKKYEEKLKKDLIDKNSIKSSQSLDFDVDICTPKDNTHHKRLKKDLITKKSIKSSQSLDVDVDICTPTDKTHHKRLKKDLITKKSIKSSQSLDADVDICTPRDKTHEEKIKKDLINKKSIKSSQSLDFDVDICTPTDKTHHKRLKKDLITKKCIKSSQSLDVDVDICTPNDKKHEEKLKKDLINKKSIKSSQSLDFDVDICTPTDKTHHKRLKKDLITKKSIKSSQSLDFDVDICTPIDKKHDEKLKKDLLNKKSIKSSQPLDLDVHTSEDNISHKKIKKDFIKEQSIISSQSSLNRINLKLAANSQNSKKGTTNQPYIQSNPHSPNDILNSEEIKKKKYVESFIKPKPICVNTSNNLLSSQEDSDSLRKRKNPFHNRSCRLMFNKITIDKTKDRIVNERLMSPLSTDKESSFVDDSTSDERIPSSIKKPNKRRLTISKSLFKKMPIADDDLYDRDINDNDIELRITAMPIQTNIDIRKENSKKPRVKTLGKVLEDVTLLNSKKPLIKTLSKDSESIAIEDYYSASLIKIPTSNIHEPPLNMDLFTEEGRRIFKTRKSVRSKLSSSTDVSSPNVNTAGGSPNCRRKQMKSTRSKIERISSRDESDFECPNKNYPKAVTPVRKANKKKPIRMISNTPPVSRALSRTPVSRTIPEQVNTKPSPATVTCSTPRYRPKDGSSSSSSSHPITTEAMRIHNLKLTDSILRRISTKRATIATPPSSSSDSDIEAVQKSILSRQLDGTCDTSSDDTSAGSYPTARKEPLNNALRLSKHVLHQFDGTYDTSSDDGNGGNHSTKEPPNNSLRGLENNHLQMIDTCVALFSSSDDSDELSEVLSDAIRIGLSLGEQYTDETSDVVLDREDDGGGVRYESEVLSDVSMPSVTSVKARLIDRDESDLYEGDLEDGGTMSETPNADQLNCKHYRHLVKLLNPNMFRLGQRLLPKINKLRSGNLDNYVSRSIGVVVY